MIDSGPDSKADSTLAVNCPTCGSEVAWKKESSYRPFCSKRCQLIDFGEWADERYTIPVTEISAEQDGEQDTDQDQ